MSVAFESPTGPVVGEFGHRRWKAIVLLLLLNQFVNHFVLALELDLDTLDFRA